MLGKVTRFMIAEDGHHWHAEGSLEAPLLLCKKQRQLRSSSRDRHVYTVPMEYSLSITAASIMPLLRLMVAHCMLHHQY